MHKSLLFSGVLLLNGAMVLAQSALIQNQQLTSGVVGIAAGQTARLNVLYPQRRPRSFSQYARLT
jgi:hypothetical protein